MLTLGIWALVLSIVLIAVMIAPWALNEYDEFEHRENEKKDGNISSNSEGD